MANTIALIEEFTDMVDELVLKGPITSDLVIPTGKLKFINAKTVQYPKISTSGLGNHSRNGSITAGDVDVEYETKTLTLDRSRSLRVDSQDDVETLGVAFGEAGRTFVNEHVVPELDATRFAKIYAATPASQKVPADLTDATIQSALDEAVFALDENEIPEENRILYMSNNAVRLLESLATVDKSIDFTKETTNVGMRVMSYKGIPIVKVPKARFYTAITNYDGTTAGQEAGGYIPAVGSKEINFILAWKPAIQGAIVKHNPMRIFMAGSTAGVDAHQIDYRVYHDMVFMDNKVKGIYSHTKA